MDMDIFINGRSTTFMGLPVRFDLRSSKSYVAEWFVQRTGYQTFDYGPRLQNMALTPWGFMPRSPVTDVTVVLTSDYMNLYQFQYIPVVKQGLEGVALVIGSEDYSSMMEAMSATNIDVHQGSPATGTPYVIIHNNGDRTEWNFEA